MPFPSVVGLLTRCRGLSLVELLIGVLLAGIALATVASTLYIYNRASARIDKLVAEVEGLAQFLRMEVDCDASRTPCTGNIDLLDHDGKVVIAADGTTKILGLSAVAKCEAGKIYIKVLRQEKGVDKGWVNLLPASLATCVVGP